MDQESSAPLSEVIGDTDAPLLDTTIGEALLETASRFPDYEAAVFPEHGVRWTYAAFRERVDALATGFLRLGLRPGDRVGIWAPNRPEWLLVQFATARIGLVLVTINPAYRPGELQHALASVGCRALVLASRFRTSDYLEMLREIAFELSDCPPGELSATAVPDLRFVIRMDGECEGTFAFEDIASTPPNFALLEQIASELDADAAVNIQFTSGTTGLPKGATLTHRNIVNNAWFVGEVLGVGETDRVCLPVPLYHCFGMVMGSLMTVLKGAVAVFSGEGFSAERTLGVLGSERCTVVYGVPTMFVAMLDDPARTEADLSSLRTGIMAGAPCPRELMVRVTDEMHIPEITICYGMTETSPVTFQTRRDHPLERRVGTAGVAHPHVEAKVVDEKGASVPRNVTGELLIRGYAVMKGYWGDEQRTREAINADGWMHTGDLATIDEGGFARIVGRAKDMVIRGGENIYPREVEEFLHKHPAIRDVQVFGMTEQRLGESLCAWVILHEEASLEAEGLREHCRGAIAHYKIPEHVRFVEEFPVTATGKAMKMVMRETMEHEFADPQQKNAE